MVEGDEATSLFGRRDLTLIQRNRRAHNTNAQSTSPPPNRHHPDPLTRGHEHSPRRKDPRTHEGRIPAPQPVGQRVREEEVREQGAEVVDGGDGAALGGVGVVHGVAPARVDEDGGEDADVVAPDGGAEGEVAAEGVEADGAAGEAGRRRHGGCWFGG